MTDGVLPQRRSPQLRTPFARAVVPVLAGIAGLAVLAAVLWGIAAWLSSNGDSVRLGSPTFEISRIDRLADSIATDGPQLYPDLKDPQGARSVVVHHVGDVDADGWLVYRPFPFDRPGESCLATQRPRTAEFVDCENRVLDVTQLQIADDVRVTIRDGRVLVLTFAGAVAESTVTEPSTTGPVSS